MCLSKNGGNRTSKRLRPQDHRAHYFCHELSRPDFLSLITSGLDLANSYIRDVLLPCCRTRSSYRARAITPYYLDTLSVVLLLLLDNHDSHIQVDFMYEAYQNKVYLVYLVAHTSYTTQPLDLAP